MKFEIDVLQWSDDPSTGLGKMYFSWEDSCISHPSTGLGKMYFSWEDSCISHYLLCISLLENTKFPTKWSHFPGRRFLISTFFPTMSSNGRDNESVGSMIVHL